MRFSVLPVFALVLTLIGCTTAIPPDIREEAAKRIAIPSFMTPRYIETDHFNLKVWERVRDKEDVATLYIEGDGFAFANRSRVSDNPTPINPVALHLASRDGGRNVIYLARPCQYQAYDDHACDSHIYWTTHRYAPEVIEAYQQALNEIKNRYRLTGFNLVGYSGGGGIAALIAARRDDVLTLRTVAGNLDHEVFSDVHKTLGLKGSLNPADIADQLTTLPQHHFIGGKDNVVPPAIYNSYRQSMGESTCIRNSFILEASHNEGWVDKWEQLLTYPVDCLAVGEE